MAATAAVEGEADGSDHVGEAGAEPGQEVAQVRGSAGDELPDVDAEPLGPADRWPTPGPTGVEQQQGPNVATAAAELMGELEGDVPTHRDGRESKRTGRMAVDDLRGVEGGQRGDRRRGVLPGLGDRQAEHGLVRTEAAGEGPVVAGVRPEDVHAEDRRTIALGLDRDEVAQVVVADGPESIVAAGLEAMFRTAMEEMGAEKRVNLIFLDACRDNPFANSLAFSGRSISSRGLAQQDSSIGSLIAFATQPNNIALDGSGRNSPFTQALLKHLKTPGLEIRTMLARVRNDVIAATGGKQVPWENSSLTGEIVRET